MIYLLLLLTKMLIHGFLEDFNQGAQKEDYDRKFKLLLQVQSVLYMNLKTLSKYFINQVYYFKLNEMIE